MKKLLFSIGLVIVLSSCCLDKSKSSSDTQLEEFSPIEQIEPEVIADTLDTTVYEE